MASNTEGTGSGGAPKRRRAAGPRTAKLTVAIPDEEVVKAPEDIAPPSASVVFQGGNVRFVDVTLFLRQLIMLLEAGTPILKSLKTMSQRGERAAVRDLVADIALYVESGNPLWQAFDRHPRYFDAVFVNLIKASEASGTLVTVLRRVVEYRESSQMLAKRVRSAMIYPVLLVGACLGVILLLTKLVVPEFKAMFERASLEIPWETQVFLAVSDTIGALWWLPFAAILGLVIAYRLWWVRNPVRRLAADRIKLRIPVLGPIVHKNAIVEMTRTMALLLRSGLSMMATLDLTRSAIHNRAVAQSLQAVRDSVERGGGLETPMRESSDVIPAVVTDMFATGEEAGRVDQVAEQIALTYEEEVKISVASIGEAIQPIFTVIIGIAVMVLFVALFLPLISMMEQLSGSGV